MAQQTQIKRLIEMGVSQVGANFRDMMLAMAAMAQQAARARVEVATNPTLDNSGEDPEIVAAALDPLTDNSTGTPAASLVSIGTPVLGVVDGATSFSPKTGFDTAIGLIEDAHEEIGAKLTELIAVIGGPGAPAVATIAAAATADDTIAACNKTLTGATTGCVPYADAVTQIVIARNNQAALAAALNWCRVALGLAPVPDNTGGVFERIKDDDYVWPTVDQAATGTAVSTNGDETTTDASVDAILTALVDNIGTMADFINECLGPLDIGPFVVATNNPGWRFFNQDVTVGG